MALTFRTISSPGNYPDLDASGIAVAADGVTLQRPKVTVPTSPSTLLPTQLYGIEQKRKFLLGVPTGYYKRLGVLGQGFVSGAKNKGVLAPGKDFVLVADPTTPFEISECGQDGIFLSGDNFHIEGAKIDKLGVLAWDPNPHADGIQVAGGYGVISQCFINLERDLAHNGNACVYVESDIRKILDVHINSTVLLGSGTNYSLFIQGPGKYGAPRLVRVFNATIKRGRFGWLNWGDNSGTTWVPKNLPRWLEVDMATCQFLQ